MSVCKGSANRDAARRTVLSHLAQAVKLGRIVAEQGDEQSQQNLAHMYKHGRGVAQDYVEAHFCYSIAASGAVAGEVRGIAAKNRDELAAKITAAQLAENERRAREWKPR